MKEHESYFVWKAYADKGVAIQTSFERMQSSFKGTTLTVVESVVRLWSSSSPHAVTEECVQIVFLGTNNEFFSIKSAEN